MHPLLRTALGVALAAVLMNALRSLHRPLLQTLRSASASAATRASRNMHIQSIPMWEGTGNNYAYLLTDEETKQAAIIDPANPPEVLPTLQKATAAGAIDLRYIINTHHHADHAGGNAALLQTYPLPVLGGADCAHVSRTPPHNSTVALGRITLTALHTPCHTRDSICWFAEDGATGQRAVFSGDTLFVGGCGRFFEGSAAQMDHALSGVLAKLPDDTATYPGHEYTRGNVKFGVSVVRSAALERLEKFAAENKETQGRFTIADEKEFNVFMRLADPEVQKATGETDRIKVMAKLREMKNAM